MDRDLPAYRARPATVAASPRRGDCAWPEAGPANGTGPWRCRVTPHPQDKASHHAVLAAVRVPRVAGGAPATPVFAEAIRKLLARPALSSTPDWLLPRAKA